MHRTMSRLSAGLLALVLIALAGAAPLAATEPIDLNRAGVDQLISLPGVGEAIAKRIVEFREEHGPFTRVEDLLKVRGIGEKSFEKIRPLVRVGKPN